MCLHKYVHVYTCHDVPSCACVSFTCMTVNVYLYRVFTVGIEYSYMHVVFMYTDMLPQPWLLVTGQFREAPNWMFAPTTSSSELWTLRRLCGWGGAKFCSPEDCCGFVSLSLSLSLILSLPHGQDEARYPEAIGLLFWLLDRCKWGMISIRRQGFQL